MFRFWLGAWKWLEKLPLEAEPDNSWASRSRVPPYLLPQGCFLLWFICTRGCKLTTTRISAWNMSGGGWKTRRKHWAWEQAFPTQNTVNPLFLQDFLMWTIFKAFIGFVTLLLLFYDSFFRVRGTWNSSSSTRDWTHTPCIGRWSFNHWITRAVPVLSFSCELTSKIPNVLQRKTGSESIQAPQCPLQPRLQ